jgi:signal transduction histidine kinase
VHTPQLYLGYVVMLLDEDLGPLLDDQREYLATVQGVGHRLLIIVNDLLDVTRIEAVRLDLILRPTDLAALVKAVATEYRPQVENKV